MGRFRTSWLITLMAALMATPVLAQSANFQSLKLSPGFKRADGVVTGNTGGSYSLPAIANRDVQSNPCIGFAAPTPDHVMVLENNFSKLKIQVDSRGKDTTLVIKGPDNIIRCGDDTGTNKDASIQESNWKAGEYRIWVGSIDSGKRWNYTLRVEEQ